MDAAEPGEQSEETTPALHDGTTAYVRRSVTAMKTATAITTHHQTLILRASDNARPPGDRVVVLNVVERPVVLARRVARPLSRDSCAEVARPDRT